MLRVNPVSRARLLWRTGGTEEDVTTCFSLDVLEVGRSVLLLPRLCNTQGVQTGEM